MLTPNLNHLLFVVAESLPPFGKETLAKLAALQSERECLTPTSAELLPAGPPR